MNPRALLLVLLTLVLISPAGAQDRPAVDLFDASVERAVRRDVPLTRAIRRAFEAGTRDFSGRPGPNYWQLRTDYTIQARLNPSTQTISGSETILVHNASPAPLDEIVLRLDHNIFRADVPRGFSVPAETTEGMVVTRLAVDGAEVDLYARPPRFRGRPGPAQASPRRLACAG